MRGLISFWNALPRPIVGLSPMDGVTDAAYRLIMARHGRPDVIFTEFTAVERIVRGHDRDLTDLRFNEAERPIVAQLFGIEPESFYRAAHIVGELGFDGIDINMGCPSKNIANRGAGAGLIRTPELAREILRRTRQGIADWAAGQSPDRIGLPEIIIEAVRRHRRERGESPAETPRRILPVSVKTRLGYERVVIEDWLDHLLAESPAAISLHGRTLAQHYRGEADWEAIARASEVVRKSGTGTLLLGNGDIRSAATAVRRVRETGVDGVLLGRVTMGNPWIFTVKEAIRKAVQAGLPPPVDPQVSPAERFAVATEHAELFQKMRPNLFHAIRKHLAAYCRGFENASELRRQLVRIETLADVESILGSAACA
jgi:tRNA-dihydrouridine synthase